MHRNHQLSLLKSSQVCKVVGLQLRDKMNRKAEILLEILNAGDAVEAKIRQHRDDIDEDMLQMLFKRIEATQRCDPAQHGPACIASPKP